MKKTTLFLRLLVITIALFFSTNFYSQTTRIIDLIATEDTYIRGKVGTEQTNNYGSCDKLLIDREEIDLHRALLQFDLSEIPGCAVITTAELILNCTKKQDMNVSVFQIGATDVWDEGSSCAAIGAANWNIRTGTSPWSTTGVVGAFNGGTPLATINANVGNIQSWTITSLVQDWFSGTAVNNGVMLGSQDGTNDKLAEYESTDKGGSAPPKLRVTYTIFTENDMDSDFDGVPDYLDIDADNDGITDEGEGHYVETLPLEIVQVPNHMSNTEIPFLFDGESSYTGNSNLRIHSFNVTAGDLNSSVLDNALVMGAVGVNIIEAGSFFTITMENDDVVGDNAANIASDLVTDLTALGLDPNDLFQGPFNDIGPAGLDGGDFDRDGDGSVSTDGVDFSPMGVILQFFDGDPTAGGTLLDTSFSQINLLELGGTQQHTVTAPADVTHFVISSVPDGTGNDIRINEIQINGQINTGLVDGQLVVTINSYTLDIDNDGIPDHLDLDSDNDGIPNIVEAGLGSISNGTGKVPLSAIIDVNGNGMHDPFESATPLDTDGDGIPNFQDLDSDNDGIFDVDEARTKRYVSSELVFDNGDGDIDGDGVGDGPDSESFRINALANGCAEYFGDGILDIYDYGTGPNEYGNLNQGSAPYFLNDEDGDGTPDYLDLDSNNDGTFDIAETHYASLDANNDGIIDDTTDTDGDGLLDLFDTDDAAFGSPRDLQGKFELFFDGRNDYVEDTSVINGWSEATLMAWIKIAPTASGDQIIMGQNSFYLQLNSDKTISTIANGNTVTNGSAINTNQWTHVAASYSNSNSELKLFINGEEISSTAVSGALPSDSSSLSIGRQPDTDSNYFSGCIDEARVYFKALPLNELQKMVYQEIEDDGGNTKGVTVPLYVTNQIDEDTSIPLVWNSLKRYYRMDAYKGNVLDDLTTPAIDEGSGARIYNTKLIESQSAPLPFVTSQSGRLDVAVNDPIRGINGADAINNESAIVRIAHNDVYVDSNLKQVGLMLDAQDASSNPIEFSVKNDSELNVSWYLELDGKLDLEGESQLVQGAGSILDADSSGFIEKDQQGTANSFNYNYWSSSVGPIASTGARGTASLNNNFTIQSVLLDGSAPDDGIYPKAVKFLNHGTAADSGGSDPIIISTYWLWKYNGSSSDYNAWQKIYHNTPILPGEGYTMKGTSGSVPILNNQNYVFKGKPNNGDFTLPITVGNDRLIGNPYPSALDADKFIKDNLSTTDGGNNTVGNVFNGALYFWDHFGEENSHYVGDYVGGYATRNLIGGAPAIANDKRINDTGGIGTKVPGRYIPVNQGFFVITSLDEDLTGLTTIYGGDIVFKNSQRVFMPEAPSNSVFMRYADTGKNSKNKDSNSNDSNNANNNNSRPLIRLQFDSPKGIHRQILAGVDKNATNSFDLGYDAILPDLSSEDLFWNIQDTQFVIQGVDNFDYDQELPLGLIISEKGIARIAIDSLENMDPYVQLYIKDNSNNETYEITNKPFDIELEPGEYYDRFSLVFQPRLQTLDEVTLEQGILIYMNDSNTLLQINRLVDTKIESIKLFNSLGQSFNTWDSNLENRRLSLPIRNVSTGMYIVQLETSDGVIIRKMLVK